MEIVWNNSGKEPLPPEHVSSQESSEPYPAFMRIFPKYHDSAGSNKHLRVPGTPHVKKEPATPEYRKILLTLMRISYVLKLIHECGTVLLPRNWQN